jgi:hypothetical protein
LAFQVFPTPPTTPLGLAPQQESALIPFAERVGVDPVVHHDAMFIRVVQIGTSGAPGGPPQPTIRLKASAGAAVTMTVTSTSIFAEPGGGAAPVATGRLFVEANGVFRIRVLVNTPGSTWQLQIVNRDAASAHSYTWVVADNDAETSQPWIDVPEKLDLDVVAGEQQSAAVQVTNRGTGPLVIADVAGDDLGSGFRLTGVPDPIAPNGVGQVAFTFTAPGAPAPVTASSTYRATSNDTTALLTAGHNRQVALSATVRKPRLKPGTVVVLHANSQQAGGGLTSVDPTSGAQTELAMSSGAFVSPVALAVEPDGDIIVLDRGAFGGVPSIVRVDPVSGAVRRVSNGGMLVAPSSLTIGRDGAILVADSQTFNQLGGVISVHPGTGAQIEIARGGPAFRQPAGVAVRADGTIIMVADTGEFALTRGVFQINPQTGTVTPLTIVPASPTPPRMTDFLAVEATGAILITRVFQTAGGGFTIQEGIVARVDSASGQERTLARNGSLRIVGLAIESDGRILVANDVGTVTRIDPVTGQLSVLASDLPFSVRGVAVISGRSG